MNVIPNEVVFVEEAYDALIDDMNALEQAIEEVCGEDTIAEIKARKQALQQK